MNQQDTTITGQAAVVTGSSSGIGRAIAIELARAGADVLVHARRNKSGAEETAAAIRVLSRDTHILLADLSDHAAQDEFLAAAWKWRPIDIWVNNAGVDVLTGPAADWSFEQKLAALWKVDVEATLRFSRGAGELMKNRGSGTIINIGWDQAATGLAGDSGQMFAATKGAVMAMTRALAKSFAPNVRVNCVAPGWIRTDWGHEASDYWQKVATGDSLMARWGEPADIAHVVRFLASPAAAFVNGQVIDVNGGRNDSRNMSW
jgi:3-oxoacyl-[acyl-carrier protein] reductase